MVLSRELLKKSFLPLPVTNEPRIDASKERFFSKKVPIDLST